jgi:phospholipid/cholesterol/gamma-HCH transport system substrate-binding protein
MATNNHRGIEIGTGLFVLLGFAALAFLTTQLPSSGLKLTSAGAVYRIEARFDNVGDLKAGAPVTMAGVRIGRVDRVAFDSSDYKAVVSMSIDQRYDHVPDDSDAAIQTAGLLGAQYIALTPGGSEIYLKEGSEVPFTQSALVLENLVNKLFASFAGKSSDTTEKK